MSIKTDTIRVILPIGGVADEHDGKIDTTGHRLRS